MPLDRSISRIDQNGGGSAYQQNLARIAPINTSWHASAQPTTREMVGRIYQVSQDNPAYRQKLQNDFTMLTHSANSRFYNPYSLPTNRSVMNLRQYGIDTSVIDDNFFQKNDFLRQYLIYDGTTNTPTKPGKKASDAEKAAYEYYQIWKSEDATRKAEQQWSALQDELSYWANRADRNMSDDQIIGSIDWTKYGELAKMDELKSIQPPEYNRAIGYSKDAMYGVLWNARNGTNADMNTAMAMSYLGEGNKWEANPELAAKLDEGNKATYSPYSVGSTMDEEGMYFGVPSFSQQWLEDNRSKYLGGNDETAKKYYANVVDAEDYTLKLESELADLHGMIDSLCKNGTNAEFIIDTIQNDDSFRDLFTLDDTMRKGKSALKNTTRAVDYRWADIEREIRERCWQNQEREDVSRIAEDIAAIAAFKEANPSLTPANVNNIHDEAKALAVEEMQSQFGEGLSELEASAISQLPDEKIQEYKALILNDPVEAINSIYQEQYGINPSIFGTTEANLKQVQTIMSAIQKSILEDMITQVSQPEAVYEDNEDAYRNAYDNKYGEGAYDKAIEQAQTVPTPPPVFSDTDLAFEAAAAKDFADLEDTVSLWGTIAEKVAMQSGKTMLFNPAYEALLRASGNFVGKLQDTTTARITGDFWGKYGTVYDYEQHVANKDRVNAQLNDLLPEYEELNKRQEANIAASGLEPEEYNRLMNIEGAELDYIKTLDHDAGMQELYRYITGMDIVGEYNPFIEDFDTYNAGYEKRKAQAELWYNVVAGSNEDPIEKIKAQVPEGKLGVDIPTDKGTLTVSFKKGEDGALQFVGGYLTPNPGQPGTSQRYTADQKDEVAALLGGSPTPLTQEEMARLSQLEDYKNALEEEIQAEDSFLQTNETNYKQSKLDSLFAEMSYENAALYTMLDGGQVDYALIDKTKELYNISKQNAVIAVPDYDGAVLSGTNTREEVSSMAMDNIQICKSEAEEIQKTLDYLTSIGVNMDDESLANINRRLDSLNNILVSSSYVALDGEAGFDKKAEAGLEKAKKSDSEIAKFVAGEDVGFDANVALSAISTPGGMTVNPVAKQRGERKAYADAMTPEEKNRFFYLLYTEGEEAAEKYFGMLTDPESGEVAKRVQAGMVEDVQEYASENVFNAAVATAFSFGTKAMSVPMEVLAGDYSYREMTNALRSGSAQALTDLFGAEEGSVAEWFINSVYYVGVGLVDYKATSALVKAWGGLIGEALEGTKAAEALAKIGVKLGVKGTEIAKGVSEILPLTMYDASGEYQNVYNLTRDKEKAAGMACVKFVTSLLSHTLITQGLRADYQANPESFVEGVTTLMHEYLKTAGVIGASGLASNTLEQVVSKAVLDGNSMWDQNYEKYKAQNIPDAIAQKMADEDMKNYIFAQTGNEIAMALLRRTITYTAGAVKNSGIVEKGIHKMEDAFYKIKDYARAWLKGSQGEISGNQQILDAEGNYVRDYIGLPGEVSNDYVKTDPTEMTNRRTGDRIKVVGWKYDPARDEVVFVTDDNQSVLYGDVVGYADIADYTDAEFAMLLDSYGWYNKNYASPQSAESSTEQPVSGAALPSGKPGVYVAGEVPGTPLQMAQTSMESAQALASRMTSSIAAAEVDLSSLYSNPAERPTPEAIPPVYPDPQNAAKDQQIVQSIMSAKPEAAATGFAAILNSGDAEADRAAAQTIIDMCYGDTNVSAMVVGQVLMKASGQDSPVSSGEAKSDIAQAALTSGSGHRVLEDMIEKTTHGEVITQDDVNALHNAVASDRQSEGFEPELDAKVKENVVANKTIAKGSKNPKTAPAKRKVKTARANAARAKKNAEDAHALTEAAAQSLVAAHAEYIPQDPNAPVNQSAAGPLEQNRNKVKGAVAEEARANEQVAIQEQKAAEAEEELRTTQQEVMNEARAEATVEAAQEEQQRAETIAASTPPNVIALRRPQSARLRTARAGEPAKMQTTGEPVQITGVFAFIPASTNAPGVLSFRGGRGGVWHGGARAENSGGSGLEYTGDTESRVSDYNPDLDESFGVYRTADGSYVTDQILDGDRQMPILHITDRWLRERNPQRNPVNPAMWFNHSLKATTPDGEEVQIVGIAGQDENGDVLMTDTGRMISLEDVAFGGDPISGRDGESVYFDFTENMDYNGLPTVESEKFGGAETDDTAGSETEARQLGNEVPAQVPGNNGGELPSASGQDVRPGNLSDVGFDGGAVSNGGAAESPTQPVGQAVRGDPERLLSKQIINTLKEKGVTDMKLTLTDPERFSSALEAGRESNPHGLFVDAQSPEALNEKGAITILSSNGLAGAAVATQGDEAGNIFGVFKNARSRARKASAGLIINAVAQGGDRLDCFDGGLRNIYASVGMIPVSRTKFNRKYAPEGWNYERDGEPDVVMWMLKPGETAESIASKYKLSEAEGGFHRYSDEEIAALPLFEDEYDSDGKFVASGYDKAIDYRNKVISGEEPMPVITPPSVNAPPTRGTVIPPVIPGAPEGTGDGTAIPTNGSAPLRQFNAITAQKSKAVHDSVKQYLRDNAEYMPDTNLEQVDRALDWVSEHVTQDDPTGFFGALDEIESDGYNFMSPDGQAQMVVLASMAALNNNEDAEARILEKFGEVGTNVGQTLQARKIFFLMTPSGRKAALKREVNKIQNYYQAKGKNVKLTIPKDILDDASKAKSEGEYDDVRRRLSISLGSQIPSDWKLRLRTLRMTAMLANPRTHFRNLEGNTAFIPMVGMKDAIGAVLEKSVGVKKGERTKSIRSNPEADAFAAKDAEIMAPVLQGTSKYMEMSDVERNRKAFGTKDTFISRTLGKGTQRFADFSSSLLEKEDKIYLTYHYKRALSKYMAANGYTPDDMKGSVLKKAREYAVLEAQKATYRDANTFASWLSNQGNKPAAAQWVIDAVQPFVKTPANIARRGVEYSPLGLVASIASARSKLEAYKAWEDGGFKGPKPKNAKSPSEVFDKIAAGFTGTMIAGLGAWLSKNGVLKIKATDSEKLHGSQDYSIEIDLSGIGLGKYSVGIGNVIPFNIPLFFGGSAWNAYEEMVEEKEFSWGGFLNTITDIFEPLVDTTMMSSLNSLLDTTRYSSTGNLALGELAQKIIANYIASYFPSFVGAVARTVDPTKRKAFVGSGDDASIWTAMVEQTQNKFPFLSMHNIPYINAWGEEEKVGYFEAFLQNFILPDKIQSLSDDKLDNFLAALEKSPGVEGSMFLNNKDKTLTVNKETIKLTDQQWYQYHSVKDKMAKSVLQELIERPEFLILSESPEVQSELVKKVYKFVKAKSALDLFPEKQINDTWTQGAIRAYNNGNLVDYIFAKEEEAAKTEFIKSQKSALNQYLFEGNADGIKTSLDYLRQNGIQDSTIKNSVTSYFKPLYLEACRNDADTAINIQTALITSGLGYDSKNFKSWRKIDPAQDALFQAVMNSDINSAKSTIESMIASGKNETSIKKTLSSYFKPICHNNYHNGEQNEANRIADVLSKLGLGFEYFDFKDWTGEAED